MNDFFNRKFMRICSLIWVDGCLVVENLKLDFTILPLLFHVLFK